MLRFLRFFTCTAFLSGLQQLTQSSVIKTNISSNETNIRDEFPGKHFLPFFVVQYFESILMNGVSGAFVIPHHSSKTCIIAAVTMTSHLLGYTSIDVKTQLVFYSFLVASFRIANLRDPYSPIESFGSKIVFGGYPMADQSKSVTNGNKKVNFERKRRKDDSPLR